MTDILSPPTSSFGQDKVSYENMSLHDLQKALEDINDAFRHVPDEEKDFLLLQETLEGLLAATSKRSDADRKVLMPVLKRLQEFLVTHLEEVQKQAAALGAKMNERITHKKAVHAYGRYQSPHKM